MTERLKLAVYVLFILLAGGVVAFILFKHVLPVMLPFIIAWCIAGAMKRPAEALAKRVRIPERLLRLILSLIAVGAFFALIFIGAWRLISSLWGFLSDFGEGNALYDLLVRLGQTEIPFLDGGLPEELAGRLRDAINSVISSGVTALGGIATSVGAALPGALLFVLVTVTTLVYFALDLERINAFALHCIPAGMHDLLLRLGANIRYLARQYIRSYLILMLITFGLVLSGLLLIGVSYAPLIALVIALLDALPVIGAGTVLLPWSIFELAMGRHGVGIGLAVLFVVNTVVRQILEPKIVGKSLDMHPVLTLLVLYVGYSLLGLGGVLLTPAIALLLAALLGKEDHSAKVDKPTSGQ